MGETIHPLSNLNVDPAIRSDNVGKAVMNNDFIRDDVETETHVLGVLHGSVKVEISKVDAQKLDSMCHGEISRWCALVSWIVNLIATNGEPNAIFLLFLWLVTAVNASVGGAFVS